MHLRKKKVVALKHKGLNFLPMRRDLVFNFSYLLGYTIILVKMKTRDLDVEDK